MPLVSVTGLAVVWAGVVELLRARVRLASALRIVLWANVGAALVLAVFSATLAPLVVLLVGLAVAIASPCSQGARSPRSEDSAPPPREPASVPPTGFEPALGRV